jgi:hypothetical protein
VFEKEIMGSKEVGGGGRSKEGLIDQEVKEKKGYCIKLNLHCTWKTLPSGEKVVAERSYLHENITKTYTDITSRLTTKEHET